ISSLLHKQSKVLLRRVANNLNLSDILEDNICIDFDKVDIHYLIEFELDEYQKLHDNKILVDLEEKVFADCDPGKISQVIYNMLEIATNRYGESSEIVIGASNKSQVNSKTMPSIEVYVATNSNYKH